MKILWIVPFRNNRTFDSNVNVYEGLKLKEWGHDVNKNPLGNNQPAYIHTFRRAISSCHSELVAVR